MAWVKLDTGIFRNPKVITVGADGKLLYIAGICYAGDNLTDGLIPTNALPLLAAEATIRNHKRASNDLVDAGLWVATDGGFQIHSYLEHNTRSGDVQAKREAAKERMQRIRSQDVRANNERSSQNVRPTKEERTQKEEVNPPTPTGDEVPSNVVRVSAPRRDSLDDRWQRFWATYPRHEGTGAARKAFSRIQPDDALLDMMLAAIEVAKQTEQWQRDHGKFIPHASTWLNQQRWEDEVSTTVTGPTGVDLLPGESAEQTAPGHWELTGTDGRKRWIKPEWYGVVFDSRLHRNEGRAAFDAAVAEAKSAHEHMQEAA